MPQKRNLGMKAQLIIKIVLLFVIVFLVYRIVDTIAQPILFQNERDFRYGFVKKKLVEARKAQLAYKDMNGKFADNWDDLINFVKNDNFRIVRMIGDPEDTTAVLKTDTVFIKVLDSIFNPSFAVDSMKFVPFTDGKIFEIRANRIIKGGVELPVFEIEDPAPFDVNKVLRVGSLTDASYSGNWE